MNQDLKNLKVALVTDWLTNLGGAEKVVKVISDLFPEAPIYTTVVNRDNIGDLAKRDIRTSWLQHIPVLNKKHQFLLPLLPKAIESLDMSEYDLVISFSSAVAKSVITTPEQTHICYIHTPIRYVWEPDFDDRFRRFPKFTKPAINWLLERIKKWDYETRHRPNFYIANSTTTQARVKKYYGLDTEVLYPPVETKDFSPLLTKQGLGEVSDQPEKTDNSSPSSTSPSLPLSRGGIEKANDYYLAIGRLVTYKKFDLLVETFKQLPNKKLFIIGSGPEEKSLKTQAQDCANIVFMGQLPFSELKAYLAGAKALLLPQKEDAGIVQLEAFASGIPVIGFKEGGLTDVLMEGVNGVFFEKQEPKSVIEAIKKFENVETGFKPVSSNWNKEKIRVTALPYDTKEFQENFVKIVEEFLKRKN